MLAQLLRNNGFKQCAASSPIIIGSKQLFHTASMLEYAAHKEKIPKVATKPRFVDKKKKQQQQQQAEKLDTASSPLKRFYNLGLVGPICRASVQKFGFVEPTSIQKQVIPHALKNNHVWNVVSTINYLQIIASAETGTGKTAAYVFPILQELFVMHQKTGARADPQPHVLILCPTKELAEQVDTYISQATKHMNDVAIVNDQGEEKKATPFRVRHCVIVGHTSRDKQERVIQKGLDVLVGTPGRILELLRKQDSVLDMSKTGFFVIDECDKMMNMGFLPDIRDIFSFLPKPEKDKPKSENMRVFMFSATLVPGIEGLMKRFAPVHKLVNLNEKLQVAGNVKHIQYHVSTATKKYSLLLYLLGRKTSMRDKQVLVFCRTKQKADRIAERLVEQKIKAMSIHKEKSPSFRSNAIQQFKDNQVQVLISTDVLARGIDVENLPYVINYDIPALPEDYVHRVGRTGRAGNTGMAISFVSKASQVISVGKQHVELNDLHFMKSIEEFLGQNVELRKVPGTWNDELDQDKIHQHEQVSKQKAFDILQKKKETEQKRIKHLRRQHDVEATPKFSATFQKLKQQMQKSGKDVAQIASAPTLRSFKEGRYENVIAEFEKRRARKRGVTTDIEKKKKRHGKSKAQALH